MVGYYVLKSDIIFSGKKKPYYLHINITNIFIKPSQKKKKKHFYKNDSASKF